MPGNFVIRRMIAVDHGLPPNCCPGNLPRPFSFFCSKTSFMRVLLLITCTFLLTIRILAQPAGPAYTTLPTTNEKARTAFNEGKQQSDRGEYAIAQGSYEQALKKDTLFIDAYFKLADTYVYLRDFFKAERYFEKGLSLDSMYAPAAFYFLAQVEWQLEKYAECAAHAQSYLSKDPKSAKNKSAALFLLANARFVAVAVQHPVPFNPRNLGPGVNTTNSEYFPSITADGSTMIFTRNDGGDENFFQTQWKDNAWQPAEPLKGVNTVENEGAQAISVDGSWIAFTACDRRGDGSQGSCDLYWSQLKAEGWTTASPFSNTINTASWEAQPTISANGKNIVFSSNRPGGRGKIDLWETTRQANGKWIKPENLGPLLNTGGEDQTPFLHPDGQTLYFSSDSLPGMGGNDIYFSRRQPDGRWGAPQNLGYPINTKGEDVMLTVSLDGMTAYYASNRPGGQGRLDMYAFDLPEHARPRPVTYARAKVTDALTGYPIVAKVDFIDLKTGQSYVSAFTKKDGSALVCLPAGTDYALNVSKDKYLFYSENFNLLETATFDQPFSLNIGLQPISMDSAVAGGKPIVLRNVFFETASAALLPASATELDRLAALLTASPTLRIQITGHTDNVGDARSNLVLSEDRARSVLTYLVQKGVATTRLRSKGFGETQPVETNDTPEARARNRRTEFVVW